MREVKLTNIVTFANVPNIYQDAAYLFVNTDVKSYVNMKLGDAVDKLDEYNMLPLDGAKIIIREGFNNTSGDIIASIDADYDGNVFIQLRLIKPVMK